MVDGIRMIYLCGLSKGFGSKFCVGSRLRHETLNEGRRTHRPERCEMLYMIEISKLSLLYWMWMIKNNVLCKIEVPQNYHSGLLWFGLVLWHINHCRLFNAKSIFIHINSSISNCSVKHKYSLNVKQFWPINRTLSGAITPNQSRHGNYGNDGAFRTHQSSSINEASPLDY